MIEIAHGGPRRPIPLSATRKYFPEHIMDLCRRSTPPYYITVENTTILVNGPDCLELACTIAAAYHNGIAYNAPEDDGFTEEMDKIEAEIQTREARRDG